MGTTQTIRLRQTRTALCAIGIALMLPASAHAAEDSAPGADAEDAGQVAFNTHCRTCHSVKPGDNRLGPTLHGIHGAKAGQVKDFKNYSGQLNETITWDDATLDKFLENPTAFASNTTMKPFGGIPDAGQRKLIIDYLKTADGS